MRTPKLPNPYVVADQLVDLRHCLGLSDTDREVYKATQAVIDWLEGITLRPDMAGGPTASPAARYEGGRPEAAEGRRS